MPQIPTGPSQTNSTMTRRAAAIPESGVRANGDAFGQGVAEATFSGLGRIANAEASAASQAISRDTQIVGRVATAAIGQWQKDMELEAAANMSQLSLDVNKGLEGMEASGDGAYSKAAESTFDGYAKKLMEGAKTGYQANIYQKGLTEMRQKLEAHAFSKESAGLKQTRIDNANTLVTNAETELFSNPGRYGELKANTIAHLEQSGLSPKEKSKAIDSVSSRFAKLAIEKHLIDGNVGAAQAMMKDPETIKGLGGLEAIRVQGSVNEALKKQAAEADAMEFRRQLASGERRVDPEDTAQRKIFDESFKLTKGPALLAKGDPAVVEDLAQGATKFGIVPSSAISVLNAQAKNGTAQEQAFAFATINRLEALRPGILDASGASKGLRDEAADFRYYTESLGINAADGDDNAVSRIQEARDPAFQDRREARKTEGAKLAKNRSATEITADYDGAFSWEPTLGGSDQERDTILATYRRDFEEHYARTGDEDQSIALAKKDLKRAYNVTQLSGNGARIMKNPPEMRYPAINDSHEWVREQALEDVNGYLKSVGKKPITSDKLFIENTRATDEAVSKGGLARGHAPPYGLTWIDENGLYQTVPGTVFKPELSRAQQKADDAARGKRAEATGITVASPGAAVVAEEDMAATAKTAVKQHEEAKRAPKEDTDVAEAKEGVHSLMDMFGFAARQQ